MIATRANIETAMKASLSGTILDAEGIEALTSPDQVVKTDTGLYDHQGNILTLEIFLLEGVADMDEMPDWTWN